MSLFGGPSITEIIEANTRRAEAERWVYGRPAAEDTPEAHDGELRSLRAENERLRAEVERLKEFEWKYQELCR